MSLFNKLFESIMTDEKSHYNSYDLEKAANAKGYVKVYRGVRGDCNPLEPRKGYQISFSSKKEVADSYLDDIRDDAQEFFILDKGAREFPTRKDRDGYNTFSKCGFDNSVGSDVLVARQVYDVGPFASHERDPKSLFSYPSDIYATTNYRKNIKTADYPTYDDDDNEIPLEKRFDSTNDDIRY
ncbi:MAG: hypothetical protein WCP55_02030 [Lentisphaerota bacterium]